MSFDHINDWITYTVASDDSLNVAQYEWKESYVTITAPNTGSQQQAIHPDQYQQQMVQPYQYQPQPQYPWIGQAPPWIGPHGPKPPFPGIIYPAAPDPPKKALPAVEERKPRMIRLGRSHA